MRVPVFPDPQQYLLSVFLIIANLVDWNSISWFWFALLWWLMMLRIFLCVYWPFVYLLSRNVHSNPLPVFKLGYLSFIIELWEFFIYFGYKSIIRYMPCKHFTPFFGLPCHILDSSPFSTKMVSFYSLFNFDGLVYLTFLLCVCFWCHTLSSYIRSLIHFGLIFCTRYAVLVQLHSFARGYSVVTSPLVEKTVLSSLNGLRTLVENQLTTDVMAIFFLDPQFCFIDIALWQYHTDLIIEAL